MINTKTCGQALVEILKNYGVDTIFGIPGVHTIELYRGLENASLKHITPRHEQGAGFMADGYARVSGKPGVCFIITGPGMTNIVTAMGQALQDSVPMLVISSVNRTHQLGMGEGRLHELPNQHGLTSQVCRFSHTLLSADNLPKVLAQAFSVFSSQRPGPVHIEIPLDVLAADASHLDVSAWPLPQPPAPHPQAIEQAAALLNSAQRPLMILGGGAKQAGAQAQALAEKLSMPVINTCNAKGVMAASHPLWTGCTPSHPALRKEMEQTADVILVVGSELAETDYDFFFLGDVNMAGKVIRVDIDAPQLLRNHRADVAVYADASLALGALAEQVNPVSSGSGEARVRALKAAASDLSKPQYQAFFEVIDDVLGDCIIAGDSTQPAYYAQAYYETKAPGRYFHSTTGYGTLGYAFPAAIGAAIAAGDLPVIGLTGDGGGQFSLNEIITAAENQLPVIYVVWNNTGHGEIRRFMDDAKVQREGVNIAPPDYTALAESMGCLAFNANTPEQFADALKAAVQAGKTTLINVNEAGLDAGYAF